MGQVQRPRHTRSAPAYFQPGATVLVAAPAQRQSDELVRKCALFLERLNIRRRSDGTNRGSLVLPNLSRIVSLPHCEQTIRGFSAPHLILVDEAAHVPDELADALSPMLATNNGALWLLSTPGGREGVFYHEWHRHPSDWMRFSATAAECPRISPDFLASEAGRGYPGSRTVPAFVTRRKLYPIWIAAAGASLAFYSLI